MFRKKGRVQPQVDLDYNPEHARSIKESDLKLFQSWFVINNSSNDGVPLIELFPKLESYYIFDKASDSTDSQLFLRLACLELSDSITFAKFLEILAKSKLYENRNRNMQHSLHPKSANSSIKSTPKLKHGVSLPEDKPKKNKMNFFRRSVTTEPTDQPPADQPRGILEKLKLSSQNIMRQFSVEDRITDRNDDGDDAFIELSSRPSDVNPNNPPPTALAPPPRPLGNRIGQIIRQTSRNLLRLDSTDSTNDASTRNSSPYNRGGGGIGFFRQASTKQQLYKQSSTDSTNNGDIAHIGIQRQLSRPFMSRQVSIDSDYGDVPGRGNSIAAFFRRRDDNVDGAVRRVSKVNYIMR
jgi:hypothetical protein